MERVEYTQIVYDIVRRYTKEGAGARLIYPPSVYFNKFAEEINSSFLEGVFTSPYALYKRGVGKSVYCLKTLYYIYDKNADEVMKHIVFMPQHFLALFKTAIEKNIRIRAIVWDDAGFWIGAQSWQSRFVKAIREFLNVVRTHVITLMVNAPSLKEIARGIRDNLDILGFVRIHSNYFDLMNRRSIIFVYDQDTWSARPRRTLPPPIITWTFRQYFVYYTEYEKMRKQYVEIGLKRAETAFEEITEDAAKELEEIMKSYEYKPNDLAPEKEIDLDTLSEEEEEELAEEELGEYLEA